MTYATLLQLHSGLAFLTIAGFLLRAYWMFTNSTVLQHRLTRTLPHVIDTLFLLAGVWLTWQLAVNPLQQDWLLCKFAGLFAYILFGTIALKRGKTKRIRTLAFVAAVSAFLYVIGVALSKSPLSWIAT